MNSFVAQVLGPLDRRWLFRAYLIGVLFLCMAVVVTFTREPNLSLDANQRIIAIIGALTVFVLNTALFPFAKIVWDSIRSFILGDTFLVTSTMFLFVGKFLVNFMLWTAAIFIAPIGIGYLWLTRRA
ncbi:hypothetical protein [Ruegeria atlantica]|uniref:hypothetical protein n=1 Tax=Ruegeria atlantica TaxID=81569 RepID=UPI002495233B|nr:hypothetical protein [Ruegeria atlantica]